MGACVKQQLALFPDITIARPEHLMRKRGLKPHTVRGDVGQAAGDQVVKQQLRVDDEADVGIAEDLRAAHMLIPVGIEHALVFLQQVGDGLAAYAGQCGGGCPPGGSDELLVFEAVDLALVSPTGA